MTSASTLRRSRWLTATLWLAANVSGFGLIGAYFHNFPLALSFPPDPSGLWRLHPIGLLAGLVFGAVPALLIGLVQWVVLRRALAPSRWWVLTVSAGMGLQHFASDGIPNPRDLSLFVLLSAGLTGLLQMRLLRRQLAAPRWWLAAATGGWLLGWALSIALLNSTGLLQRAWVPGLAVQQHGLQGLIVGVLYGVLTGLVLLQWRPAAATLSSSPIPADRPPAAEEVSA